MLWAVDFSKSRFLATLLHFRGDSFYCAMYLYSIATITLSMYGRVKESVEYNK